MIFLAIMSHFCNVCHEGLKSIPAPSALYYNRLTNISKDFKFQMREIWYLFCSPIVHNTIAYCILLFQHWQKCVTITQDDAWLLVGLLYALCKATTYSVKPSWYRRSWNALTLITTNCDFVAKNFEKRTRMIIFTFKFISSTTKLLNFSSVKNKVKNSFVSILYIILFDIISFIQRRLMFILSLP